MKKILVLFISAFLVNAVHAQIELGEKAGMNFTNISGSDFEDSKTRVQFHGGIFVRFSINKQIRVQTELLFSQLGTTVKTGVIEMKYTHNYLNLPVILQYKLNSVFFAETGPQAGIHIKTKIKTDDLIYELEDGINALDFAWGFGVGYQMPKKGIGINMRYNLGLTKVFEKTDFGQSKSYNRVFQLGLFYVFNSK